jgi:hypothetical protein
MKEVRWKGRRHKVRIYKEYHCVCPLVGIGPPPPLSRKRVFPSPPEPKGGEAQCSPAGEGWGSPNSDDWRKSLALCLLCGRRYKKEKERKRTLCVQRERGATNRNMKK